MIQDSQDLICGTVDLNLREKGKKDKEIHDAGFTGLLDLGL